MKMNSIEKGKEIEIPVRWGHISGITWGNPNGIPVLCAHGILDNAGSFERLVSYLPKRFFWVAIDLPGHGHSSPLPEGVPIEFVHLVYSLKLVVDHFKWKKIYLLGHSFGAQLSMFFCAIYPELVMKAVFIDGLLPKVVLSEKYVKTLRDKFAHDQKMYNNLLNKSAPSYSYQEALDRVIINRPSHIEVDAAQTLLKRNLVVSGEGFRYSIDQRNKMLPNPLLSLEQLINIMESIKCPTFLLIAEESLKLMKVGALRYPFYSSETLNALDAFPMIKYKTIPGHHDVHMNDPETVANAITPFLSDTQSSL